MYVHSLEREGEPDSSADFTVMFQRTSGRVGNNLGPGSSLGEKRRKKIGERNELSGSLGREWVAEPGDMPLMPPIG